jgi:hypothetical protein
MYWHPVLRSEVAISIGTSSDFRPKDSLHREKSSQTTIVCAHISTLLIAYPGPSGAKPQHGMSTEWSFHVLASQN